MSDLNEKLNSLVKHKTLPVVNVRKLEQPCKILDIKICPTKYGPSVLVTVNYANEKTNVFLPQRFAMELNEEDFETIKSSEKYFIQFIGQNGKALDVKIFEKN